MSYTPQWYRDYSVELQRKPIREVHDRIFGIYKLNHQQLTARQLEVIDLGCATCEFGIYCRGISNYAGIDLNRIPLIPDSSHLPIYQGNFLHEWPDIGFEPNSFVSLFATELVLPFAEREQFYRNLFRNRPAIRSGLVAGLYYRGYDNDEVYREAILNGGQPTGEFFEVYQTIQKPIHHEEFLEMRIETCSPYLMFGGSCVEVWRIFIRR